MIEMDLFDADVLLTNAVCCYFKRKRRFSVHPINSTEFVPVRNKLVSYRDNFILKLVFSKVIKVNSFITSDSLELVRHYFMNYCCMSKQPN